MENNSGIHPVDLKVLVLPIKTEEVTKGGIVLTSQTTGQEDRAGIKARLVEAGSQAFEAIQQPKYRPKVGQTISISKYAGYLIKGMDGEDYRLINDGDVVAILDSDDWDVRSV